MMILLVQAATPAPAPVAPLRASYRWGYVGAEGEGTGTLNVLVDLPTGRITMELQGLGERLLLLEGDRASGYRVQVPRQKLDVRAATLGGLPLPFLPNVGDAEALTALMKEGKGPGITVQKRDTTAPLKIHYKGKDPKGKDEEVWLTRKVWKAD